MIEGDPVKGLERAVEDLDGDLVVMGALSRGKLADLIVGSTAERLLRWAYLRQYFSPRGIWLQLKKVRSPADVWYKFRMAMKLIRNSFFARFSARSG